jgi:hypothetical protein
MPSPATAAPNPGAIRKPTEDSVIVVGRFKGDPYDGVQLSYDAGRRNLYLTPEGCCAWHSCSRRQSKRISTSGRDDRQPLAHY